MARLAEQNRSFVQPRSGGCRGAVPTAIPGPGSSPLAPYWTGSDGELGGLGIPGWVTIQTIFQRRGTSEPVSVHLVLLVVLWAGVSSLVGIHAMNRGRSGLLWWLVTFFTGLIGVVIYLLVVLNALDDPDRPSACPACSGEYTGSPDYCPHCGEAIAVEDERPVASIVRSGSRAYCGTCHTRVDVEADSCDTCGSVF